MDDKVIQFPGGGNIVSAPIRQDTLCKADAVLKGAEEAELSRVLVVGVGVGGEIFLASNDRQLSDALMLIKRAELMILNAEIGD